jgi:hypothetical protein
VSSAAVKQALNGLSHTLYDTYVQILGRIPAEHVNDAQRILRWAAFVPSPPSLLDIAEAVAFDPDNIPDSDEDTMLEDPWDAIGKLSTHSSSYVLCFAVSKVFESG